MLHINGYYRQTRHIVLWFFLFFCVTGARSQTGLTYLSSTTGAACQAIKYYNDYVFTGTGSTLRAYYVGPGHTTPYSQVFEYRYVSQIIRMYINGSSLYVVANYDGVSKWDISNPALPVKKFDILPDTTEVSSQAVALKGDTIYVTQFTKVCAYKDFGNTFIKIGVVCTAPLFGYITGIDIRDSLCAYTVIQLGGQNGVYIRNLNTNTQLSFYQVGGFLTENVIWGTNNSLLHVMAGTNTVEGYFFTLDASVPSAPVKVFEDTVEGAPYGLAMALPYNAENHNDTIYVANWGGLKPNDLTACYIRAYDATDTGDVHLLNYLPAGLWHFDMTIHYPKMYVASEWYGIKTVDISDIINPVDEGNTLTGGWNISSDAWGPYLAVANEGYGFKLYDISTPENPVLIKVKNDPGFCFNAVFSPDGNYIYTTNITYQGMRVYRRDSLIQTGFIQQAVCNGRFLVHGSKIYSKLDNTLKIIDVSNPYAPVVAATTGMSINDMAIAGNRLYISNNDSIIAYDIAGGGFTALNPLVLPAGQDGCMMAAFNDELYVYVRNKGLVRYNTSSNVITEVYYTTLPLGEPAFIAADSFGVYVSYRKNGLFALDKTSFSQTGYYRTGLDYRKYTDMYGVQNLICKNNLVLLVEYFSQTSILTGNPNYTIAGKITQNEENMLLFPNPASDCVYIHMGSSNHFSQVYLSVYAVNGSLVMNIPLQNASVNTVNIKPLTKGIYFFIVKERSRIVTIEKVVVR